MSQAIQPTTPDTRDGADSERAPALAPPDVFDPVIEAYKQDVDRTLIRENLKLTHEQRVRKLQDFISTLAHLQEENAPKRKTR